MPLRDFDAVRYIPLLSIKPAEMNALEELPDRSKDLVLPLLFLRPWVGAHYLDSALSRIEQAYEDRPCVVELGLAEPFSGAPRPVHGELDLLRAPDDGYENWCAFIEDNENLIPALQLGDLDELAAQVEELAALDRGLVVRFPFQTFAFSGNITRDIAAIVGDGEDVCVILDFERQDRYLLERQAEAVALIRRIQRHLPEAYIATSASSFPDAFGNINQQEIFERSFFNGVRASPDVGEKLIYSDRGSARAEQIGGGGGEIPARIDYAVPHQWSFFRADGGNRLTGYREQAVEAMDSDVWDEDLHIWGTQLIERTALGDTAAIYSPSTSTAARINIHLHRQLFHDDEDTLYETDEDWSD